MLQRFIVSVLFSLLLPAVSLAHLDLDKWEALGRKAGELGVDQDTPFGVFRSLTRRSPNDLTKSHLAEHFSAVGGVSLDGTFGAGRYELVWENWTRKEDGNWFLDQWLFLLSPEGEIRMGLHNNFEKREADGIITNYYRFPSDPTAEKAKFLELIQKWFDDSTVTETPARPHPPGGFDI